MKLLIFFLGVLFAGKNLQAQESIINLPRLQERAQIFLSNNNDTLIRKGFQNMVIVPGNQVKILPQDGMPCIVPNVKEIAAMPNAMFHYPQPVAGQIPNAWKGKEPLKNNIISK